MVIRGNDALSGGTGDDVYTIGRGEGADVIDNTDPDNGLDIISFTGGIDPNDVQFIRNGDDLLIDTLADIVTVTDHFRAYGTPENSTYAIDAIAFEGSTQGFTAQSIANSFGLLFAEGEQRDASGGSDTVFTFSELLANDQAADLNALSISAVSNVFQWHGNARYSGQDDHLFAPFGLFW